MRPFAWDGERWRELPAVSTTAWGSFYNVQLAVFRGELYAANRGDGIVRKFTGTEWVQATPTTNGVSALLADGDRLLIANSQSLYSWNGSELTLLASWQTLPFTGIGGTTSIARWKGELYIGGLWRVPAPTTSQPNASRDAHLARVVPGVAGQVGTFDALVSPTAFPFPAATASLVPSAERLFSVKSPDANAPRRVVSWDGVNWRDEAIGEPFEIDGSLYRVSRLNATSFLGRVERWDGSNWVEVPSASSETRNSIGVFGRELIHARENLGIWSTDVTSGELRSRDRGVGGSRSQWSRVIAQGDSALFAGLSFSPSLFCGPQGVSSPQVASFDGYEWRAFGPAMTLGTSVATYATANDLLFNGSLLYATTGNRFVGAREINGIGAWDGQAWQSLGTGLSLVRTGNFAVVRGLLFQGDLIVGGRFDRADGQVVSNVARWEGTQWRPMGELPEDSVFAVLNGKLYAMSNALYRWDGLAWTRLGRTFQSGAFDLKVWRGELYAAGTFAQVGGEPLPYIAVFRGGDWQALAVPLQQIGQVGAGLFSIEPTTDGLLAHGRFALPGETDARPRIAKWTGTAWEPVVSGLPTDTGFMTASTQLGNERIVAGNFVNINGQGSTNYARWSPDGRPWIAQSPRSATSSIGGSVDFKAEAATGYTGLVFKWLRNGEELTDGTSAAGSSVLGANTRWLTVSNLQAADAGSYVLRISNPCGQSLSTAATLTIRCSASDVAGANQSIGSDGVLTADDIIVFLGWFFAEDSRADVAGQNQSTTPDSLFTADDIIVFLGRFFAGC